MLDNIANSGQSAAAINDATLIAQGDRTFAPSIIPPEWGGLDIGNPALSQQMFEAARNNVTLIREVTEQKGGDPLEAERVTIEALSDMRDRAPLSFTGNTFLYGATSVILHKASEMSAPEFIEYMETLGDRASRFQATELFNLTEESKAATLAITDQVAGRETFRFFGGMEGRNGDLAYSAGAADAAAEEFFGGARDLLATALNPIEAGRQILNFTQNLDQLPQALNAAFNEAKAEIAKWPDSDYNKGYVEAKIVIALLDIADVAEAGTRLNRLVGDLQAGRVTNLADALDVLDGANLRNRSPDIDAPTRPRDATVDVDVPEVTQTARRNMSTEQQTVLLTSDIAGAGDTAFSNQLARDIAAYGDARGAGAIENLRSNPEVLYGSGPDDVGLIGEALIKSQVPESHQAGARSVLADVRSQLSNQPGENLVSVYRDIATPNSLTRADFFEAVSFRQRAIDVDIMRQGSVGNGLLIDANGNEQKVFATARTGEVVMLNHTDPNGTVTPVVVELRTGVGADGTQALGFGTNDRWYPIPANANVLNADNTINIPAATDYINNAFNSGGVSGDALISYNSWFDEQAAIARIGSAGNAMVSVDGVPQRIYATAGFDVGADVVTADGQTMVAQVRVGQTADGTQYLGFGTNERWYPLDPADVLDANGDLDLAAFSQVVNGHAAAGNVSRDALIPKTQWDARNAQAAPPDAVPQQPIDAPPDTVADAPPGDQRQITGTPDRALLAPASDPNDPMLPYHSVPRSDRMTPPEALIVDGNAYDVMGMTDGGQLMLRPANAVTRDVPVEQMFLQSPAEGGLVGRDVTFDGATWKFDGVVREGGQNAYRLTDPSDVSNQVLVSTDSADAIGFEFSSGNQYTFGDVKNKVIRLSPAVDTSTSYANVGAGQTFEARLVGRELEGVYQITVGDDGALSATGTARSGAEVTHSITPADIAPRYAEVTSADFEGTFQVDAFANTESKTRATALQSEPTGLPIRDPNLGSLEHGVMANLNRGPESLRAVTDFIQTNSSNVPAGEVPSLTVFNMGFNNTGEASGIFDSMTQFRAQHGDDAVVSIVVDQGRFESFQNNPQYADFMAQIDANNINVHYVQGNSTSQVIHAKGVVVNDQAMLTTGAFIEQSQIKADITVALPEQASRDLGNYIDSAVIGNASTAERQVMAAELAEQGVLVNDPVAGLPYIARAQDALITGADDSLVISVSELTNPDTTLSIIDAAQRGADVDIQYRVIDPVSADLISQAQQRNPDLNITVRDISGWEPRPHYNVIVADGQQAYIGTAYLWPNQQSMVQHNRSLETGVIVEGQAVTDLQNQMEMLEQMQ